MSSQIIVICKSTYGREKDASVSRNLMTIVTSHVLELANKAQFLYSLSGLFKCLQNVWCMNTYKETTLMV